MSQKNDEKRPMKGYGPQPEIGTGLKQQFLRLLEFRFLILEKGAEKKDFKGQSCYHTSCGGRTVNRVSLDPRK
jgi:hypothetical protein